MGDAKPRTGRPSRSRAGCLTCKAKHRKCDETKPACLNCVRRGIECEGYFSGLKWSVKHQPVTTFESNKPKSPRERRPNKPTSSLPEISAPPIEGIAGLSCTTNPLEYDVRGIPRNVASDNESHERGTESVVRHGSDTGTVGTLQAVGIRERLPSGQVYTPAGGQDIQHTLSLSRDCLTDTSSAFIINWFEQVCSKWSGFDSEVNQNRMMAADLWRTSATVAGALESMSAGFIASRLPSMRHNAIQLMQKAANLVQAELWTVNALPQLPVVPTGLLFSLFCLGTTVCWVDARGLGVPFFREAKRILKRLDQQLTAPTGSRDRELLRFFNRCLTYYEMMLAMVRDDDTLSDNLITEPSYPAAPKPDSPPELVCESIHPWTGISTVTCELFTESVQLCRKYRRLIRTVPDPSSVAGFSFENFLHAQKIEERLLALDILSEHSLDDTGDSATPASHLAEVAEAYRLSSLIHLYQTFPDLVSLRLPSRSFEVEDDATLWQEWIIPLSLHLVKVLDRIPPTSGSRMMQPLLYISASTGLRSNISAGLRSSNSQGSLFSGTLPYDPSHVLGQVGLGFMGNDLSGQDAVSNMDIDVGNARHFIMSRLGILESSLPPTPIVVAKELVSALWRAYDNEIPGSFTVHWVDVMEDGHLQSLFG